MVIGFEFSLTIPGAGMYTRREGWAGIHEPFRKVLSIVSDGLGLAFGPHSIVTRREFVPSLFQLLAVS